MTERVDPRTDLEPGLSPEEREALVAMGDRLFTERSLPRPAFRGALWRHIAADAAAPARPRHLRSLIVAFSGSGLALLAVAALGVAGAGPFAA